MPSLFQLTNAPLSEGAKRFCKGIIASNPDACVFVDGQISTKTLFPTGPISVEDTKKLFAKTKLKKTILSLVEELKDKNTIHLTDMTSALLLPPSLFEKTHFQQLLTRLPAPSEKFQSKLKNLKFIASSQTIAEAWKPLLGTEEIEVSPPPYLEEFEGKKTEHQSFAIGVIAPLEPGFGVETVIQAFHRNREILPQVTVIVVGDGSEKKRLLWLIDHLHLRQRIQFVTSQKNYAGFLQNFDVVVFPNEMVQGYNPVLLDALAQGIPTIATSIGYNLELIEQGQTGLLFEPQNSHTLSQHLINLYNNPDWMEYYQKKGPQFVRDQFGIV